MGLAGSVFWEIKVGVDVSTSVPRGMKEGSRPIRTSGIG